MGRQYRKVGPGVVHIQGDGSDKHIRREVGTMWRRRVRVKHVGDTMPDVVEHPRPLSKVGKSARKRMQRRGQLAWPKRPKREKRNGTRQTLA